jgi:hypothetical protein
MSLGELQPSAGRSFGLLGSLTLACQHAGQRALPDAKQKRYMFVKLRERLP